ncbi:N-formylglutamate amidohydrolase [Allorhizobium undicola]|uniref:N-formylglutamate amidohydrolase n=1 Tax=Allorhizobium undicola TaxID=78527 RepID=UPI003D34239C
MKSDKVDSMRPTQSNLAPCIVVAPHATEDCPILELKAVLETGTHFALDIGIKEVALSFAIDAGITVILGDVGRLAIDLNRDLDEAFASSRPWAVPFVLDTQSKKQQRAMSITT